MTIVAFSSGGPETGTILAPRMAKYCGSAPCAAPCGAPARRAKSATKNASAKRHRRARTERMQAPFGEKIGTTIPNRLLKKTHEASQKLRKSQGAAEKRSQ